MIIEQSTNYRKGQDDFLKRNHKICQCVCPNLFTTTISARERLSFWSYFGPKIGVPTSIQTCCSYKSCFKSSSDRIYCLRGIHKYYTQRNILEKKLVKE